MAWPASSACTWLTRGKLGVGARRDCASRPARRTNPSNHQAVGSSARRLVPDVRESRGGADMSKRMTTRWYIGAWLIWLIASILAVAILRNSSPSGSVSPGLLLLGPVMVVAGVIALAMWIGAMIKLGLST